MSVLINENILERCDFNIHCSICVSAGCFGPLSREMRIPNWLCLTSLIFFLNIHEIVYWHRIIFKLALVVLKLLNNCLLDNYIGNVGALFFQELEALKTLFQFPLKRCKSKRFKKLNYFDIHCLVLLPSDV